MQRVSTGGPDYVWSRLEVSGERELLYDFVNAAAGPGFLDWEIDWYRTYEEARGSALLGRAPSLGAASMVAHAITDRSWHRVGAARRAAELDPTRCPFDLNALIPVPEAVLRRGYRGAGEAWLWRYWGIGSPLRQVTLEILQRPFQVRLPPLAAVYRFLSEDWAPAVAIGAIRAAWPDLSFALSCRFLADRPAGQDRRSVPCSTPIEQEGNRPADGICRRSRRPLAPPASDPPAWPCSCVPAPVVGPTALPAGNAVPQPAGQSRAAILLSISRCIF
jgi:hypothetical protein